MNATTVKTSPSLTEQIDNLAYEIEQNIDPFLSKRESAVCLERLEALAEYLRATADRVDRLGDDVREICQDQWDASCEERPRDATPLTIRNTAVEPMYRERRY